MSTPGSVRHVSWQHELKVHLVWELFKRLTWGILGLSCTRGHQQRWQVLVELLLEQEKHSRDPLPWFLFLIVGQAIMCLTVTHVSQLLGIKVFDKNQQSFWPHLFTGWFEYIGSAALRASPRTQRRVSPKRSGTRGRLPCSQGFPIFSHHPTNRLCLFVGKRSFAWLSSRNQKGNSSRFGPSPPKPPTPPAAF